MTESRERDVHALLSGDPVVLRDWTEHWEMRRALACVAAIVAGAGLYGAAMGYWRSPVQAAYNVVKFPLVIAATTLGNTLINGMLAPLLGLNLHFRQSLMLVLTSFAIASAILGAFAPILFFIIWNTPPLIGHFDNSWTTYYLVQLTQVAIIAFAGVTANTRLLGRLQSVAGNARVARKVLAAWLAGNLFLGSQFCWILRPFIGSPGLPVEFLRPNAFQGNFYETVFRAIAQVFSS